MLQNRRQMLLVILHHFTRSWPVVCSVPCKDKPACRSSWSTLSPCSSCSAHLFLPPFHYPHVHFEWSCEHFCFLFGSAGGARAKIGYHWCWNWRRCHSLLRPQIESQYLARSAQLFSSLTTDSTIFLCFADLEITVFERSDYIGGRLKHVVIDGATVEGDASSHSLICSYFFILFALCACHVEETFHLSGRRCMVYCEWAHGTDK